VSRLDQQGTWRALTTLPQKFALHGSDAFFRESWGTAADVLADRAAPLFQRLAILTMKPDMILTRRVAGCLRYMVDHGFRPVHAERFTYTRSTTRELWRYQWNVATLDRIQVSDLVHYRTPAMTVFFLDTTSPLTVPAAARLTTLKGSAFPSARQDFHLRTVLGAPNRVMVLAHCPDEPMDIVRELGIVFDRGRLANMYRILGRALDSAAGRDVNADIEPLYAASEQAHLDVPAAVIACRDRLADAMRTADRFGQRAAGRAHDALDAAVAGHHLPWPEWSGDLEKCGIDPRAWDFTLVASHYIQHDIPNATCLITETGRRRWLAGEGLMLAS